MTLDFLNYGGAVALDDVQQLQPVLGTGVTSGCAPSLASSTTPITIDVASGTAYVANSEVTFSGGSIELPDGDAQHPRKDVVYIDSTGSLQSLQGTPREPKDGTGYPGTDRTVYQPEPPDLSSLSSLADAAVVAEIWVPVGATGTDDMTDSDVLYVRDRRLRPWATALQTTDDDPNAHAGTHSDGGSDELDVADLAGGAGTNGQVPQTDGAAVSWATLGSGDISDFNEAAQDAVGATLTDGLAYDDGNNEIGLEVVDDSTVTLSSGSETIDTGNAVGDGYDYDINIGDTDGAEISAVKTETGGNHALKIEEVGTSIGNPTVSYTIWRM